MYNKCTKLYLELSHSMSVQTFACEQREQY